MEGVEESVSIFQVYGFEMQWVVEAVGKTLSSRIRGSWLSGHQMLRAWQFVLELSYSLLLSPPPSSV